MESLGRQVGSRQLQYLEYDNVPDNALLLLRNLTKGKKSGFYIRGRETSLVVEMEINGRNMEWHW